jgi:nicotinate-nucleotide adenylyltransferase
MKIGVLGGTFDPPHVGHIKLAEKAVLELGLDRVLWIPAFIPPHKELSRDSAGTVH